MSLSSIILEKANQYRDYTARNLSRLVQTKSLSTKEENVIHLIESMMKEAGFDEVFIDGLGNVIGRIGNGKKLLQLMVMSIQLMSEILTTGHLIHSQVRLKMDLF